MTIRPNDGPPPDRPFGDLPNDGPIPFKKKGSGGATDAPTGKYTETEEKYLRWRPVPISALQTAVQEDWYWFGYLGAGLITAFTGLWKAGKTTMLSVLLKKLDGNHDTFCGQAVKACRVILVTEEAERHWIDRRDTLGLGDHVMVVSRPFMKCTKADWLLFIDYLRAVAVDNDVQAIIFDSIFNLWAVTNENDNAEVKDALMPLNALTEAGLAVLLVGHPSKGDQGEGRATRGAGSFPGFVDIITEMRRLDSQRRENTQRVLTSYSRFEETPEEMVIEYDKERHDYTSEGTRSDVTHNERVKALMDILPDNDTAYTLEEILQNWISETVAKPSRSNLQRAIDEGVKSLIIGTRGTGKRGEPKRYYRIRLEF